jgi:hypothetical protein
MPVRALASTLVLGASLGTPSAFAPSQQNVRTVAKPSSTGLNFGIPTFQPKNTDDDKGKGDTEEKKIDMKGLAQLITAGMGSPFLGDFEGVDKDVSSVREAHVCIRACIAHIIDLQARATPPPHTISTFSITYSNTDRHIEFLARGQQSGGREWGEQADQHALL